MRRLPFATLATLFLLVIVDLTGCGSGGDGGGGIQPEPCSLTITAPGAGGSYQSGDPINIRWDRTGEAATVAIELWQGGSLVGTISAATENDGFFPWTASVMGGVGGNFSVRVIAAGENGCEASSGVFALANTAACAVTLDGVILPDTTLVAGQTLPITWQSHDTMARVGIELWHGHLNAEQVGVIAEDTPDDGAFDWVIDSFNFATHSPNPDPTVYWLKVFAEDIPGCEDHTIDFTLEDPDICNVDLWLSPLPHLSAYTRGDTINIGYILNDYLPGDTVKIRLYAGEELVPGGYITPPGEDLPAGATAPWTWVVTDFGLHTGTSNYRIRVIKVSDPYCWGASAGFAIDG